MKKLSYMFFSILFLIQIMHASQVTPLTTNSITAASLNYAASTNAGLFAITSAGYYYLTEDLLLSQAPSNTNPVIFINANNVVLDLGTKTIAGNGNANTVLAGIQIADGISNVTIKNGVINGISSTTSAANGFGILINSAAATTISHIILENLSIFGCGYLGIMVSKCNDLTINNVVCTGNGLAINASVNYSGGMYLETINTGSIKNCSFSNNALQIAASNPLSIVGAAIISSSDLEIVNSYFDNNSNTTSAGGGGFAAGLFLQNSQNCIITHVTAHKNTRSNNNTVASFGFRLLDSSGNKFTDCHANSNASTAICYGFSLERSVNGSIGNIFVNCVASLNTCTAPVGAPSTSAYGFSTSSSDGNQFIDCTATSNNVSNATIVNTINGNVYGFSFLTSNNNICQNCQANGNNMPGGTTGVRKVAGFYSAGCFSNQFLLCQANRNNLSSTSGNGITPNSSLSGSFVAGFQFGDFGGIVETSSILRQCIANNNTTAGSGTSAQSFGVLILPTPAVTSSTVSLKNIIEYCETTGNNSANTAVGRSYGIVDLTPGAAAGNTASVGSTTIMRANFSIGHGACLVTTGSKGDVNAFTTNNLNYYLDYSTNLKSATPAALLGNVVLESNIGNLTTGTYSPSNFTAAQIAGGYGLYSFSFTTS